MSLTRNKLIIFLCLFFLMLSCKSTPVKEEVDLPEPTVVEEVLPDEGWIGENSYRVKAIGYPSPAEHDNSQRVRSAEKAAIDFAMVKIREELYAEMEREITTSDMLRIRSFTEANSKIVKKDFVEDSYSVVVAEVKQENLKKIIKTGDLTLLKTNEAK